MPPVHDNLPQPKRRRGRPSEGKGTIHKHQGEGLTPLQVQYLLRPDAHPIGAKTWRSWLLDHNFTELRALVDKARVTGTAPMVETARAIIAKALNGELGEGENDKLKVDVAWRIMQAYPETLTKTVIFRPWHEMNPRSIPDKKLRRIAEEIATDKSIKQDVLPVDHVGHTKLGTSVNREPGSEEKMMEDELLKGVYDTFEEGETDG